MQKFAKIKKLRNEKYKKYKKRAQEVIPAPVAH